MYLAPIKSGDSGQKFDLPMVCGFCVSVGLIGSVNHQQVVSWFILECQRG
jgi:hypothetical protein